MQPQLLDKSDGFKTSLQLPSRLVERTQDRSRLAVEDVGDASHVDDGATYAVGKVVRWGEATGDGEEGKETHVGVHSRWRSCYLVAEPLGDAGDELETLEEGDPALLDLLERFPHRHVLPLHQHLGGRRRCCQRDLLEACVDVCSHLPRRQQPPHPRGNGIAAEAMATWWGGVHRSTMASLYRGAPGGRGAWVGGRGVEAARRG
mmetsp:Transcript_63980/g.139206  ORF Transcript_63980/g.139206 Transcript_63980/m.139206 type:complete len:204 (-) Transcript_63980:17-628(-)